MDEERKLRLNMWDIAAGVVVGNVTSAIVLWFLYGVFLTLG